MDMSETQTLEEAQAALEAIDPDGWKQDEVYEIIAEIMGERAAFGDSAPGSEAQLQACRAFLANVQVLRDAVAALTPPPVVEEGAEEPF